MSNDIREQQLVRFVRGAAPALAPQQPYSHVLDAAAAESHIPIAHYWQMLLRRRWTIITVVAVITTLVAISSFRMKPVYRATARVEIDSETPQVQSLQDMYQQMPTDEDYLRTEMQVIKTDQLAWRTIQQLALQDATAFTGTGKSTTADPETRKAKLTQIFQDQLSADLVPSSRIIRVSFESTDPRLAARVANGLVDNFIEYNFREKYDATRQASGRMEQQLDELKAKVEKSQQALVQYQREHSILNISDKQSLVEQRLADLSAEYSKAQGDRIQKEALYSVLRKDPEQIASLAQNDLLQKLQEKYADLSNEYVQAQAQYGPSFPKVVRLQKQVAQATEQIQKERGRVLDKVRNDYVAAAGREKLLAEQLAQQKEEVGNLNILLVQQNILAGEFESNQKMYQTLLQRLKDATVSAGLRATNIHLVDPATAPVQPVRPKKLQNICLAFLSGLILAIVGIVIQESLDQSVKTSEEAETILLAPALTTVPSLGSLQSRRFAGGNGSTALAPPALVTVNTPKSAVAEAYRALRTSVLLSFPDRKHRIFLVTSANAGEGKTCTAVNFATSLSQRGESVLLVECDLRRPSIARVLSLESRKGLSTMLAGRHSMEEVLQQPAQIPTISVIPAGPIAYAPSELLSSDAMEAFLQVVSERYQYVILDSPPMLAVTDASVLSTFVDGVIVVVEGGVTARRAVAQVKRLIDATGAKLLGLVLNKVDVRHGNYYGYYGRSYYHSEGAEQRDSNEAQGNNGPGSEAAVAATKVHGD